MRIAREQWLTAMLQSDLRGAADAGLAPLSDSDQDIDDVIGTQSFSFYHPSGTCVMGKVVDHELRVHGLENVRVADTSIMPTLVNPLSPGEPCRSVKRSGRRCRRLRVR